MTHEKQQKTDEAVDRLLDRAAGQIRESEPDPRVVADSAARTWAELEKQGARRGLQVVRGGADTETNVESFSDRRRKRRENAPSQRWGLWAIAALLILGIGVAQFMVRELWPAGPSAEVVSVDGDLFRVSSASQVPIAPGDQIAEHEVVRTGREGSAVVRLEDGSLVELRARSEMAIDDARAGTTLELERGSVIVEAAQQREKHLYVETSECLVSVTGTIFSVNHGTKGSRVSVIEGEVRVNQHGDETVLRPGQQVATHAFLGRVPVEKEVAWSRNVDEYIRLLEEYSALEEELAEVPRPGLRYSSRLLDLMPEDTVLFASAPNLSGTLSAAQTVLEERLDESPELAEWWQSDAAGQFHDELSEAIDTFSEFGSYLGDELAVGGQIDPEGELDGVLVLAELVDSEGLRDFLVRELSEIDPDSGIDAHIVFVDDPFALPATGGSPETSERLYLWLRDDLAVASPSAGTLQEVARFLDGETNGFVGSGFYEEVATLYQDGVEFAVAADLAGIVHHVENGDGEAGAQLETIGVANARYLVLEQKRAAGKTHHRSSVTFDGERQGVASWLAEPAPMGGLDFVSPDAALVMGVVFKDPVALLDDVYAMLESEGAEGEGDFEGLRRFEEEHGLSLRDDVAASLGGEMIFALDGPMLPKPAWKVILEVYDPARFQWAIEEALAEANVHLAAEGEEPLELEVSQLGGRTVYTLPAKIMDVHYTFVEGYLLMAADKALLDQAVRYESSGYSILASRSFSALLPPDGQNNVSALVYQDLGGVMKTVAERLARGEMTDEQRARLDALAEASEPSLGYAYGEPQRIVVAASSDGDMVSKMLLRVLGMKNPAGMESVLETIFG